MNTIKKIDKGSIAEELEIEVGDLLLSINGLPVNDIIDFMYLTQDDFIEMDIQKGNGEVWTLEIEKEYDEPIGITFENPIMDQAKRCSNNCLFCFIDQLPPGMRDSLYFKDDDSRLSFLQGNFVTLTNLKESDMDRIIAYRISPINVSVHTTDPELRKKMLGNRFADQVMPRLKRLTESGIVVNAQIVLCPGYNDGEALSMTLSDLSVLYPGLNSIAVVPIGRTRYRAHLPFMAPVDETVAKDTIDRITICQEASLKKYGSRIAFAADEFYLKAGIKVPEDVTYEGYLQFEDGIGMIRKLLTEVKRALSRQKNTLSVESRSIRILTGVAAYETLCEIADMVVQKYPQLSIKVQKIENDFFGPEITVVGLLTGKDLMEQVSTPVLEDIVLLPESIFRAEEAILLDDVTLDQLIEAFQKPVLKVKLDGADLLDCMMYGGNHE